MIVKLNVLHVDQCRIKNLGLKLVGHKDYTSLVRRSMKIYGAASPFLWSQTALHHTLDRLTTKSPVKRVVMNLNNLIFVIATQTNDLDNCKVRNQKLCTVSSR